MTKKTWADREKEILSGEPCCVICAHCYYTQCSSITGNPIDYVCKLMGKVIDNAEIKNCDEHFKRRE